MNPRTFRGDAILITLAMAMLTLVLASVSISIPITCAEITELNVEPEVVAPGETISITGKAEANEPVWLSSSFELPLDVDEGKYSREFIGIDFPAGEKRFSVRAENIKNIQVSLSPVDWPVTKVTITCSGQTMTFTAVTVFGKKAITHPLEESIDETEIAMFSISLPTTIDIKIGTITLDIQGKKNVKVEGDAAEGATSVDLKISTSIKVNADSNGDFSLDLDTEGVPEGIFWITAGEEEETVYIGVTPTPTPSPSPSPSPTPTPTSTSSNGGDGNSAPDTTLSPTPSPSPTRSPSPSPTSTATPATTAASAPVTPTATTTSIPSPTPSPVTPTPSPSPSPTPSQRWIIPGFDAVFAIAGLLAVAYLVLRKRRE